MHSFSKDARPSVGRYVPPGKDLTDYRLEAEPNHITRAVVVQASVDGTDNSRIVQLLQSEIGIALRGVAMIDPEATNLQALNAAGIRALRIQDRTRLGLNELDSLPALARRAAEVDWHIELNTEPARYDTLAAQLATLPGGQRLVLDHIGHVDPTDVAQADALCRLLDTGRVWVKLALTRVSRQDDFGDLAGLVARLASGYPDRCLWGSDWPHVMTEPPLPDIGRMLAFLAGVLSEAQMLACTWTNPSQLYRF
ncbi:MAG: amidohydrolase family protein [Burkholderiaceae bacterium]